METVHSGSEELGMDLSDPSVEEESLGSVIAV